MFDEMIEWATKSRTEQTIAQQQNFVNGHYSSSS